MVLLLIYLIQGTRFYILISYRSKYWSSFVNQLFGRLKDGEKRNIPMKKEYYQFKRELARNFTNHQVVGKC